MKNNQIFYYIHPLDRIQLLRITKIGNIIIYKINNSAVIFVQMCTFGKICSWIDFSL